MQFGKDSSNLLMKSSGIAKKAVLHALIFFALRNFDVEMEVSILLQNLAPLLWLGM